MHTGRGASGPGPLRKTGQTLRTREMRLAGGAFPLRSADAGARGSADVLKDVNYYLGENGEEGGKQVEAQLTPNDGRTQGVQVGPWKPPLQRLQKSNP